MKKFVVSLITLASAFVWTSCSDDNNITPSDEAAAKGKAAPKTNIWSSTGSLSGNLLTISVDGTLAQAASHLLIQAVDCNGNIVAPTGMAWVNGVEVSYTGTTGNGTDCYFSAGQFIKIDSDQLLAAGVGSTFTVTVGFSQPIAGASMRVKSGQSCSPVMSYAVNNCNEEPPCTETKEETSWAGTVTNSGNGGAWFASMTVVNGTASGTLYAGQHHNVGNVSVSTAADGSYNVTVTLATGVSLKAGDNTYMESYATAVTSRPVSGQMAYKGEETGTSYTWNIANNGPYVAVHVNVLRPVACDYNP